MGGLISVVIPIYKVEEYLDRCIDSVVNQTYKNLEIILVDDGSPDSCPAICDEWAKRDDRIVVLHKTNGGIADARNKALDVASGEYITFVDSDDYLSLDAITLMYTKIVQMQCDMVVGKIINVYSDGHMEAMAGPSEELLVDKEKAISLLRSGDSSWNRFSCWSKLYKRELFDQLRFQNVKFAEDMLTWAEIFLLCESIVCIPDVTYYYYQRSSSLMHTFFLDEEKKTHEVIAYLSVAEVFAKANYKDIANGFYHISLHKSQTLQNKKEVRKLANEYLWKTEGGKRNNKDIKTLLLWMSLYVPIYSVLQSAAKKLKK